MKILSASIMILLNFLKIFGQFSDKFQGELQNSVNTHDFSLHLSGTCESCIWGVLSTPYAATPLFSTPLVGLDIPKILAGATGKSWHLITAKWIQRRLGDFLIQTVEDNFPKPTFSLYENFNLWKSIPWLSLIDPK